MNAEVRTVPVMAASETAVRSGRLDRVVVIAREEFRRALESRWLFGSAALLAVLILGVSFFGLGQSRGERLT